MGYEIRSGTKADSEGILEVIVGAYELDEDSLRYPRQKALAFNAPHEFRVMVEGERVIGVVHIGDTWIQVGKCAVLKGDVGHVGIRPELQGRGLGTAMMQDTVRWLRESGYHLSRLGGLMKFYRRFGYEPFVRRFVEFEVHKTIGARRVIPAAEAYPAPTGFEGVLRPYDEARDWQARHQIRYAFDHGRSGAAPVAAEAHEPASPTPPDPDALRFVYELDGEVKGYLFAAEAPLEAREGETCFSISDFAYRRDCPQAAARVLKQLLARLVQFAPARITSRLPFDEALAEALQENGVGFTRIERHQSIASNMIQVLNLRPLLEAIGPELEHRLAASLVADWAGSIEFALPAESCSISVDHGAVKVTDSARAHLRLEVTQAQFVKALFGINAFGELPCSHGLDLRERALMDALFPRTQTGSGPWG